MAITPMPSHEDGEVFPAADYMKLKGNIEDLDSRLGPVTFPDDVSSRLTVLEQRTTNTTTSGGIGNQRLADRLGTGVTVASTATAQLAALDSRIDALEAAPGGGGVGAWAAITSWSNSWLNRSGSYQALRVRSLAGGNVQMIGVIQTSGGSTAMANGAQLFTLPSSLYYPEFEVWVPCGDSGGNPRYIRIDNTGKAYIFSAANVTNTLFIYGMYPSAAATA